MKISREFRVINRSFSFPIITSNFSWNNRKSVVLRERSARGDYVYGEVAPTPSFPNQPAISQVIYEANLWSKGIELPSSNSLLPAISCMRSQIWQFDLGSKTKLKQSILDNPDAELHSIKCIKKKIGLLPTKDEVVKVKNWLDKIPSNCKVRLDPNGSFSTPDLMIWLDEFKDEDRIEFIEQPLPDSKRQELFKLSHVSPVPLAIDETVVAMGGPRNALENGWNGFYVIKPTLLNDWTSVLNFVFKMPGHSVISTVFESPFGFEAILRMCKHSRLESGVSRDIFKHLDSELVSHHEKQLFSPSVSVQELDKLWHRSL